MPTNPEQSPSSEHTLQHSPLHQDGLPVVRTFDNDEVIYRRYLSDHFVEQQLVPQHFQFPNPSFNRSKFSRPEDVLHADCCDGKVLGSGWGVLECLASAACVSIQSHDNRTLILHPTHVPLPTCYAHSELSCIASENGTAVKPSPTAKEKFRIKLAKIFKERIQATS
jgi:hypothetical protein